MNRPRALALALLAVLSIVVVIQAVMLLMQRDRVTHLQREAQERVEFCNYYSAAVSTARLGLERRDAGTASSASLLEVWRLPPFLKLCRVPESAQVVARTKSCIEGTDGYYDCLSEIAKKLDDAIP